MTPPNHTGEARCPRCGFSPDPTRNYCEGCTGPHTPGEFPDPVQPLAEPEGERARVEERCGCCDDPAPPRTTEHRGDL